MYENIKKLLADSENVVFFTGAGMSTESGIPDFRSAGGLYSEGDFSAYRPETILSRSFFLKHTDIFYDYYFSKIVHRHAVPNDGHIAIAGLEKTGRRVTVVTQNIDGLHQAAGSTNVLEVHGSVFRNYCMDCGMRYGLDDIIQTAPQIPACSECGGTVRPDVTMYEEALPMEVLSEAVGRIADADMLFAIGSSLTVYPAAGLLDYFRGDAMIIINRTPTAFDRRARFVIRESCGSVLNEILGGSDA